MPPKKGTTVPKPTPNAAATTTGRPHTRSHMRDTIEVHSQSPDPDTNDGGDKDNYYNAENGLTN